MMRLPWNARFYSWALDLKVGSRFLHVPRYGLIGNGSLFDCSVLSVSLRTQNSFLNTRILETVIFSLWISQILLASSMQTVRIIAPQSQTAFEHFDNQRRLSFGEIKILPKWVRDLLKRESILLCMVFAWEPWALHLKLMGGDPTSLRALMLGSPANCIITVHFE